MSAYSSLGFPFAAPRGAGPAGALAALAAAVAAVALAPWRLALHAAAAAAALLLRALTTLGAPPLGYIPQAKLAELTAIMGHMHERDDAHRRAVAALQAEVEAKERDRRRAARRAKAAAAEADEARAALAALQRRLDAGGGGAAAPDAAPPASTAGARAVAHASVAAATAAAWLFCRADHPALQFKLLFSVFFPLLWAYVSWLPERRAPPPAALLLGAWFLLGFVAAQHLSGGRVDAA